MKPRFAWAFIVMVAAAPGAVFAQGNDETLADIRQEMSVLYVEIQRLKRELSTTGSAGTVTTGGSLIDRVTAIEGELRRLTKMTEELEFRIDRVVRDGSNQIGDLEFRLCELETNCDISTLGQGSTLGGEVPVTGGTVVTELNGGDDPQFAVGEQADFDTAMAAMEAGDYTAAAAQLARFQQNYPGSPLSATAGIRRGEALEAGGELTKAARAFLETFSAAPNGPQAPEALYHLGRTLGALGKVEEACLTLGEVGLRFPGGAHAQQAQAQMQSLGCL